MDMVPVHNRDARAPAPPPVPDASHAPEQPTRRAASDPASELARVQRASQEMASDLPAGNGFRYEVTRPGSVEIVLYNIADGTVTRRIPLEGESVQPSPRSTREFRA